MSLTKSIIVPSAASQSISHNVRFMAGGEKICRAKELQCGDIQNLVFLAHEGYICLCFFDNTFDIMAMLQDQTEGVANSFLDQASWVPEEGKKLIPSSGGSALSPGASGQTSFGDKSNQGIRLFANKNPAQSQSGEENLNESFSRQGIVMEETHDDVIREKSCPEREYIHMPMTQNHWEHFPHGADIGIRGVGTTLELAFEQAALALTAVITDPQEVKPEKRIKIDCEAPDDELLFVDWLNALIYEMAAGRMLFSRFEVAIRDHRLMGAAWGEKIDPARHQPGVEVKGATYTMLAVRRDAHDEWIAQCVVDV